MFTDRIFSTGNYLRVRGEYKRQTGARSHPWELPPRARRIPIIANEPRVVAGTTSACAENTLRRSSRHSLTRNYLRVRGEYGGILFRASTLVELPPRARRIRLARG